MKPLKQYWIFIFILAGFQFAYSQIDVRAQLDTNDILIGDHVQLSLSIIHDADVLVTSIDFTGIDSSEVVEIISAGRLDTLPRSDGFSLSRALTITSFDSGYHFIPPIEVLFEINGQRGSMATNELGLNVNTILINNDSTDIAPIKPIIVEPIKFIDILPYLAGTGILIALISIIQFYLKRRRQPKATPKVPARIIPPHLIALEKIDQLRKNKLWQQGKIKDFQSELTRIVREYLEKRFHIPALELTTDETLKKVKTLDLKEDWVDRLKNMFQIADLVKFAKAKPPADFHEKVLLEAESFIIQTKSIQSHEEEEAPGNEEQPSQSEESTSS